MDPATPLETLCRIVLRAREYEAQTPSDYDSNEDADNVNDEVFRREMRQLEGAYAEGGIHEAIACYEDAVFYEILAEEYQRSMQLLGVRRSADLSDRHVAFTPHAAGDYPNVSV